MKKILFFSLFFVKIFSYSLVLINDSPFELTAVVQSASGVVLGQENLQPNEQRQWTVDMVSTEIKEIYNSTTSVTPFTVVWKCAYKGYYSINSNVSPGATVKAQDGVGSKECTLPPKKTKKE